jgi:hypothetical protein
MPMQKLTTQVVFSPTVTTATTAPKITDKGYLTDIGVTTPTWSAATSTAIIVKDNEDNVLVTVGTVTRSSFSLLHLTNPIPIGENFSVTASTAAAVGSSVAAPDQADLTVTVDLYIQQ